MTKFLKAYSIFVILTVAANYAKAQFVTIPDANFVTWLNSNGFSTCMNGNQLDTTCSAVVNATTVSFGSSVILNLTGITYFDNLTKLSCSNIHLSVLPALPPLLTELDCWSNQLTSLPILPSSLEFLDCSNNSLTSLPVLPSTLTILYCDGNLLTSLPILPNSLTFLNCGNNLISSLPTLGSNLLFLSCSSNQLTSLPVLPNTVFSLLCSFNQLTSLTVLPNSLLNLTCDYNQLTSLPMLPNLLQDLECNNNQLTSLPTLPNSLEEISCNYNLLTSLPTFPNLLDKLECNNNQLTFLPYLPISVSHLDCSNNLLYSIQNLPDTLIFCYIENNPNLVCLPSIKRISSFNWSNTGIICLPNMISVSFAFPALSNIPLCKVINVNNCPLYWNIKGRVYNDQNVNCILDSVEPVISNIKLNLFEAGVLKQQTFSSGLGEYSFKTDTFSYTYFVDTTGLPFEVNCPPSFNYTSFVTLQNQFHTEKDFSLSCKLGFDVGVSSMNLDSGIFRPANFAVVSIAAGDMSSPFNLNCASGVSGNLRVIINGLTNFVNAASGSLIPLVNGDTLNYSIPDFGLVNFYSDFRFLVQTDTLAQLNDQVCFNVLVTPIAGDNNSSNNYYTHCFSIVNSYDPNDKQVSPSGMMDTSLFDLTYTVRFQNTGNAPAQHIYVLDTLDQNIDESSFQLLAYSHEPQMQIVGKRVRFNFPNINLPDSVNNEPESHGFVQYRVKRYNNLPIGTQIHNTAYIYFDFNAPVQTNTTVNEIAVTSGVGIGEYQNPILFSIFPNPLSSGQILNIYFNSSEKKKAEISVFDLSGRKLFTQFVNASEQSQVVALPNISPGVYLVVLNDGKHTAQQKLVVMQ